MESIYSLRKIEVCQGAKFTLAVENLELHEGRIYAVTGPNGAGKSTLLRTLALLMDPVKGRLDIRGRSICRGGAQHAHFRRQITLVEQSPYLFQGSVHNNLAFGLRVRGVRGNEQQQRIACALSAVGLEGFEHRKTEELSGGEVQRVALARALALRPKVLLLDEPTSYIDRGSLREFERLLVKLPQQGITVILSTHDLLLPQRLGAEVIQIEEGRIVGEPRGVPEVNLPQAMENMTCQQPLKALGT